MTELERTKNGDLVISLPFRYMHHCSLQYSGLRGAMAKDHGAIGQCFTACLRKYVDQLPEDRWPMEWKLIVSFTDGGWHEVEACPQCGYKLPEPKVNT